MLSQVQAVYARGNFTVADIAERFHLSSRTVHRYLNQKDSNGLPTSFPKHVVVLMDTIYFHRTLGVVIFKDSISGLVLWFKFIEHKEMVDDYMEGLQYLESMGCVVQGVVCDGLMGLREQLEQKYLVQFCQFHQLSAIIYKITQNPKEPAGYELLQIAYSMKDSTKQEFCQKLHLWQKQWATLLSQKRVDVNVKKHYTYKKLRSAFWSLRHNIKWLFTCRDYPELCIPNTNNGIESLNLQIRTKLNLHKGISVERRKRLIRDIIIAHKPNR